MSKFTSNKQVCHPFSFHDWPMRNYYHFRIFDNFQSKYSPLFHFLYGFFTYTSFSLLLPQFETMFFNAFTIHIENRNGRVILGIFWLFDIGKLEDVVFNQFFWVRATKLCVRECFFGNNPKWWLKKKIVWKPIQSRIDFYFHFCISTWGILYRFLKEPNYFGEITNFVNW